VKYDNIGKTYNKTRMADERITGQLVELLDLPVNSRILDIGAGSGNYSYELAKLGYNVIAIEPSETMRKQGKQHEKLEWREGIAESLPADDKSVDGVICTLATHHFDDLALSFREMNRVVTEAGRIVIFTADPRKCFGHCWITDYFREIVEQSCQYHPPVDELAQIMTDNTRRKITIRSFPLPYDLKDNFFFSGWKRPEAYLDENYRAGISSLATAPKELLVKNIKRLTDDLKSGEWLRTYGFVLNETEYDCGYVFLVG
jgi:ubiquinone/menaquinone biosynthesis C-methylase UbiE